MADVLSGITHIQRNDPNPFVSTKKQKISKDFFCLYKNFDKFPTILNKIEIQSFTINSLLKTTSVLTAECIRLYRTHFLVRSRLGLGYVTINFVLSLCFILLLWIGFCVIA